MKKNIKLAIGIFGVIALAVLNMKQYGVLGTQQHNVNSRQANSQRPYEDPNVINVEKIDDFQSYQKYPVSSDLFNAPKLASQKIEKVVSKTKIEHPKPQLALEKKMAPEVKILAVSSHKTGRSALIQLNGDTKYVNIGDVVDGKYRVSAITSNAIELTRQESK